MPAPPTVGCQPGTLPAAGLSHRAGETRLGEEDSVTFHCSSPKWPIQPPSTTGAVEGAHNDILKALTAPIEAVDRRALEVHMDMGIAT